MKNIDLRAKLLVFELPVGILTVAIALALAVANDWGTRPWIGLAWASIAGAVASTTWARWRNSKTAPWIGLAFSALMIVALVLHWQ